MTEASACIYLGKSRGAGKIPWIPGMPQNPSILTVLVTSLVIKKDEWGFGVGGEGTTAEVSASANVDFLHVKAKDSSTGHDEHLFSIGASPKLTAGVGGEASISGKKVIDTDFIDVHTVNVKLGGKLGLGLALDITLPYIWAD